jgi:hypothetical protein
MRVGKYELYKIENETNMDDLWMAFNAVTQFDGVVGVAVLNHKIKLNDNNHVLRLGDLMCDFSPRCTLVINNREYDSDTFTRDAPLNMLSDDVLYGGVQISPNDGEHTATMVFLMESFRQEARKSECAAAFTTTNQ